MDLLSTLSLNQRSRLGLNALSAFNPEVVIGLRSFKGNTWFVNSAAASGGNGASWDAAVTTLSAAVALAAANDLILVAPGHTEAITAAAGLVLNKAGLSILGLGNGRQRPTINFTTATTADIDVNSAGITIQNIYFDMTGIDALVAGLDVNAADFALIGCEVELADAGGQAAVGLVYDDNCDRMRIVGNSFHGAGDTTAGIAIDGAGADDVSIIGNLFNGYFGTTGAIQQATTAGVNWVIDSNVIVNRTANGDNKTVVLVSTTVAIISNNRMAVIDAISPAPLTAAAGFVSGNYSTGAVGVSASTLI
jgi:hypothetical protein